MTRRPGAHERRVIRRLEARGEPGLGEALILLDGTLVGGRYRIVSLYAVGSEGAVYLARDEQDPAAPQRVAKLAALPVHRPFDLTDACVARRRAGLREEAADLTRAATAHLPRSLGLFETENPALERSWGGEFAAPEPCLVMEKLPGFDLDLWLARVHRSSVPQGLLRRHLDHVAVVVLSALMELSDRGYYYTDLRPGNVRIRGRSRERVRMMDAGSLVRVDDRTGKFPQVPAYLPADLFRTWRSGGTLRSSPAVEAAMAGRMLFEVATGRVPRPGEPVETSLIHQGNVSPPVAETIEGLCTGTLTDVTTALANLAERSRRGPVERRAAAPVVRQPVPAPAAVRAVAAAPVVLSRPAVTAAPAVVAAPVVLSRPAVTASRPVVATPAAVTVRPVHAQLPVVATPAIRAAPARTVAPSTAAPGAPARDLFSLLARAGVALPVPANAAAHVPAGPAPVRPTPARTPASRTTAAAAPPPRWNPPTPAVLLPRVRRGWFATLLARILGER